MAPGYSASVTDQESKDKSIQDYHDREGILLDPDRKEVNKTKIKLFKTNFGANLPREAIC